jgi:hypothetical protein
MPLLSFSRQTKGLPRTGKRRSLGRLHQVCSFPLVLLGSLLAYTLFSNSSFLVGWVQYIDSQVQDLEISQLATVNSAAAKQLQSAQIHNITRSGLQYGTATGQNHSRHSKTAESPFQSLQTSLESQRLTPIATSSTVRGNRSVTDLPYADARDEDGSWGYIADATQVRSRVLALLPLNHTLHNNVTSFIPMTESEQEEICQKPPGSGPEQELGWKLMQRVVVNAPEPRYANESAVIVANESAVIVTNESPVIVTNESPVIVTNSSSISVSHHTETAAPKILCVVYTYDAHHDRVAAIGDTWGWRCDGFLAASNRTVPELGAVDLPHVGPEAYGNMWQKTRSILAYVHEHYIAEYDYVHVAGDDTYVIVENLRNYLEFTVEAKHGRDKIPLYLGQRIVAGAGFAFVCGGGGHILNRLALDRFVKEALPTCEADREDPAEDRWLGYCLRELGIHHTDTVDGFNRQRFQSMDPYFVASRNPQRGFWKRQYKLWGERYGFKWGIDLVSTQTITFHIIKGAGWMKRMHVLLYHTCPDVTSVSDDRDETRTILLS